jgi:hypothetical protein
MVSSWDGRTACPDAPEPRPKAHPLHRKMFLHLLLTNHAVTLWKRRSESAASRAVMPMCMSRGTGPLDLNHDLRGHFRR